MSEAGVVQRGVLGLFLLGLAFSITLAEIALALLVGLWLLRLRDPLARTAARFPLAWPVLLFAVATVVSALRSGSPAASLAAAKGLLLLATLYVLVGLLPDVDAADRFLLRLLLLLAVVAGLGVIQVTLCPRDPWGIPLLARFFGRCDRAHGFYSIYMTLAGVLTLTLLATLPKLLARGLGRRRWISAAATLVGLGLALTYTRGAWLGFLAGVAALSILLRRAGLLLGVGGLLLLLLLPAGTLGDRLRSLGDLSDPTFRERLYMWQGGLLMIRDHPLTGVGPGQVKVAYPRYAPKPAVKKATSHLHNTPLQVAAERGLAGLAAWLAIWVTFFVRALRILGSLAATEQRERGLVAGSLAATVGFLISGLFEYNFGDSEVLLVAYGLMALPFVVERALGPERAGPLS